ncbi:MAG: hypothetical protein K9M51_02290 [Candidatus Gracilibacteria bacterium]|nr:hypothetical protein [Candidatus Gracilibacteria bacterium]
MEIKTGKSVIVLESQSGKADFFYLNGGGTFPDPLPETNDLVSAVREKFGNILPDALFVSLQKHRHDEFWLQQFKRDSETEKRKQMYAQNIRKILANGGAEN